MKTLGIIGGLGPMATAVMMEMLVSMADVSTDQEHLDCIVFNRPNVPDRTEYLLDHSKPSPAASMRESAASLEALGASYLAMPCITAHALADEIASSVSIPIINMVSETVSCLSSAKMKKTGIMATAGTVKTGLFQSALSEAGIEPVIPDDENQNIIMDIIYKNVKAGKAADMAKFGIAAQSLFDKNCDSIILGCTELSVVKRQNQEAGWQPFIDPLEVLCGCCLSFCDVPVKAEYLPYINNYK